MTTEATETQQSAMKKPEPEKEHQWLTQLLGEWTFEGEAMMIMTMTYRRAK